MDDFSFVPTAPIAHRVELYTSRFFVEGAVSGPFKRMSDVLNRDESKNMLVLDGSITPLGQASDAKKIIPSLIVVRAQVHIASASPVETSTTAQPQAAGHTPGREYYVQKTSLTCFAMTDMFVIHGSCYLHPGTTLENLLNKIEPFMPITDATVYPVTQPKVNWRRDLVLVNKSRLEVIYIIEA